MCTLNDSLVPEKWVGSRAELQIQHYNPSSALTASYEYMFQKVSEKSLGKWKAAELKIFFWGAGHVANYHDLFGHLIKLVAIMNCLCL